MATSTADIINAAGTSKGGLYNHFKSKEQLFLEELSQARKIWRERNLSGVDINGVVEIIFSGLLGGCVMYTADKSKHNLDQSIGAICEYLDNISI